MPSKHLTSAQIFDPEIGEHYALYSSFEHLATQLHDHDFFEIFLIVEGAIHHIINGTKMLLTEGTLVLMRPEDIHCYRRVENEDCQLLNVAFPEPVFVSLLAFLGADNVMRDLKVQQFPPMVTITYVQKQRIMAQVAHIQRLPVRGKPRIRIQLRTLLAEMIALHLFQHERQQGPEQPVWLITLCHEMRKPEHFIAGRSALLELAQRSEEHVGRVFKRYLGVTPSQFINALRLDYAAHLLTYTDKTIIQIAYEAGFENVSHFYRLFGQNFQYSPASFRRAFRQDLIP